jgi:hypothetical protein
LSTLTLKKTILTLKATMTNHDANADVGEPQREEELQ